MGHQIHLEEEYRQLADRLNKNAIGLPYPKSDKSQKAWKRILEIIYTPAEASIASLLPMLPSTIEKISERVDIDTQTLYPQLQNMARKGIVLDLVDPKTDERKYVLAPPIIGFFEFSLMWAKDMFPKKELSVALHDYYIEDATFLQKACSGDTVLGRALVHDEMIVDEELSSVENWHVADHLIETAEIIAVSLCYCRHKSFHLDEKCSAPMENCLSINRGAQFVIRHKFGEQITKERAKEILQESREQGLVQIVDNVQEKPSYICNCCGCCCGQLQGINLFDLNAVNPAPYYPVVNENECNGCGLCLKACPIEAIHLKPRDHSTGSSKRGLPNVNLERCIGCGLCAYNCKKKHAIKMKLTPNPSHTPRNSIERVLRMTIERGKLGHLLFDQGSSRGIRFLNKVLKGLLQLTPAQKLMAKDQVKSLFIDYLMKKFS